MPTLRTVGIRPPDASGVHVLRFLIEHSGRTQAQISKESALAEPTVSEILRRKRGLGRKHIEAFARVFQVDAGAFLPSVENLEPAKGQDVRGEMRQGRPVHEIASREPIFTLWPRD